jgi:heme exporter protein A
MSGSGPFQDKLSLRVEGLALSRGGRVLFEGLSFAADAGAYVEVRGANGAGKTSLLRAIAGFLKPFAGTLALRGAEDRQSSLHYVAHANALKPNATVASHARYWAGLFGGVLDSDVLARVGLSGLEEREARTLSQGQARRLALSRLLIAPRALWLLDEPAAALDASGHALVSELIETHRARGGIVVAAVHEPLGPTPSQTLTVGA